MSSSTAAPVNYDLFIGPLLVGVVANAVVFGICIMQLVEYIISKYKDSWKLVFLIWWVFAIDIFQVGNSVSMLWHYIVTNFANPEALASGPWEYASLPIFNAFATIPIQHFMAWRIMRFSGSKLLFAYISVLSLAQAALGATAASFGLKMTSIASHVKLIPLADAWLATSVACDMSITLLLLYYLNRSRTGFKRTDSIINRICRSTVEAAVPVSVLCLCDLIFLTLMPSTNLHYMFALPIGRLYTNTLLSTLNERETLRSSFQNNTPSHGLNLSALSSTKNRFSGQFSGMPSLRPPPMRINVEQDISMQTDGLELESQFSSPSTPIEKVSPRFLSLTMSEPSEQEHEKGQVLDEKRDIELGQSFDAER
ncbi:hypothetical protein DFH11DRAFT_1729281 [Phellopilus nigrolimitatus]|nr:hypothetical protein DFH11DRAFT_1729281 [Phellopilus nigrolimitatus]